MAWLHDEEALRVEVQRKFHEEARRFGPTIEANLSELGKKRWGNGYYYSWDHGGRWNPWCWFVSDTLWGERFQVLAAVLDGNIQRFIVGKDVFPAAEFSEGRLRVALACHWRDGPYPGPNPSLGYRPWEDVTGRGLR